MKLDPAPRRVLAAALLLVAAVSVPARAALFDDEEARKRIEATNQRLNVVQKQLDDRIAALEAQLKSQGLVELFNQIELLKGDSARLRGQIEVLTYEQNETQKRQRDLYVDLDARLRKLESAPPAAAVPPAPMAGAPGAAPTGPAGALPAGPAGAPPAAGVPGAAPSSTAVAVARPGSGSSAAAPDAAAEQRAYDAALDLFKSGNYNGAITGFSALVRTYPRSPLAPSAQYWVGNAQFAKRDFRSAIAAQRMLIQVYPDSSKVPDALLNISSAQAELNDNAAARRTLEELIAKYPTSEAAGKARQRLGVR